MVDRRKRAKLQFGHSEVNSSDMRELRNAWDTRRLVLVLGAGISVPCGLPSWRKLILDLMYSHSATARRWRGLDPEARRALLVWLCDHLDQDPLVLARLAKKTISSRRRGAAGQTSDAFLHAVRDHLYRTASGRPPARSSLGAVVDLIALGASQRRVAAVVTFNWDDLLERELRRRRVAHHVVTSGQPIPRNGIPILHPHGYLPRTGPIGDQGIVFSEDEYHRLVDSPFHWATTALLGHFRQHTAMLIGLSLSDPNLRRLLDASRYPGDRPRHVQIQRRYRLTDDERTRARSHLESARGTRRPLSAIDTLLDATLRQAETHERIVSESLGVKTIWVEDFDDIPEVLAAIGRHSARPIAPRTTIAPSARQARSTSSERGVPRSARDRLRPP